MVRSSNFFTSEAKLVFTTLRQAFVKALIFYHFDPKCYIWFETNALGYVISEVFS